MRANIAPISMSRIQRLLASSIGAKVGMAVTGILLSLFVVGHLAGNLLIYKGQQAMNDYARLLQGLGPWLWVIRAGLLAVFALHVVLALTLRSRNRTARPDRYVKEHVNVATFASRYMVMTGLLILAFVALHLAHFTLRWLQPVPLLEDGHVDVYGVVLQGFRNPVYAGLYVAAMVMLGLHLQHGLQSVFQTLGFRHPGYTPGIVNLCRLVAIVVAVGYASIPVTILLGLTGAEGAS
jgi:succinate dehydrogenase / fumarate reductase cytochrome b subunit